LAQYPVEIPRLLILHGIPLGSLGCERFAAIVIGLGSGLALFPAPRIVGGKQIGLLGDLLRLERLAVGASLEPTEKQRDYRYD
jgi:hypothetical protein